MVKPDLDLWTGIDPIYRVVNQFYILCLIGSRIGRGNGRVGSSFPFCSALFNTHGNCLDRCHLAWRTYP
ncbi:hypothetical protein Hanom_Chr12g01181461 [Helianthus anomalus]